MEALEGEAWFRRLNEQQREALQAEVEALHVDVDDKGAVTGHWEGADRSGTLKLESTVPPGAGVVEGGAGQARAHLVRSDDTGASLYVGDRTWPLEREKAPSKIAVGDWKFDLDRAVEMDWLKRSVPEGKTLEQFIQENVKTDMVIVVTPTTWNNQAYTVLDERANQFAAEANGQVVFWVRVIDDDHLSQFAGGGREFPLTRVGTDGE
jgi:hypothetical protein